jgi:RNA polymerase sigma factor, sigma-70 family
MTNEELALSGDVAALWDSLYRFTHLHTYRFYISCADRCTGAGVTFDDLIQHAYIVMYNAVQRYKADTYKFITYYSKALTHGYLRLISYNRKTALNNCVSADKSLDEESDGDTLIDIIPDPDGEADIDNVIECEYKRVLHRDIRTVLDTLPDPERDILHMRFWEQMTYEDIALIYNMSWNEVHNVEERALRKLRSNKIRSILNEYLN